MLAVALLAAALGAEPGMSKWPVDDADPESSIPTAQQRDKDPLQFGYWLMDCTEKADGAVARGDHARAIKYWRALARAVPDRSVAFAKLCASYRALGDRELSLATCKAVLARPGVGVGDFATYADLVLAGPAITEADAKDVGAIVDHLRTVDEGKPVADRLAASLAQAHVRRPLWRSWQAGVIALGLLLAVAWSFRSGTRISKSRNAVERQGA